MVRMVLLSSPLQSTYIGSNLVCVCMCVVVTITLSKCASTVTVAALSLCYSQHRSYLVCCRLSSPPCQCPSRGHRGAWSAYLLPCVYLCCHSGYHRHLVCCPRRHDSCYSSYRALSFPPLLLSCVRVCVCLCLCVYVSMPACLGVCVWMCMCRHCRSHAHLASSTARARCTDDNNNDMNTEGASSGEDDDDDKKTHKVGMVATLTTQTQMGVAVITTQTRWRRCRRQR